jgi:SagB-type dehydrogenase family enzyme
MTTDPLAPAAEFFERTRLDRNEPRQPRQTIEPAEPFKTYPGVPSITLPRTGWQLSEARIRDLLQQRRSQRRYATGTLTLEELAFLLWATQGVTAQAGNRLLRTAPSAGALYPVETYVSLQRVQNAAAGLYHFDIRTFSLSLLVAGDQGIQIAKACLNQRFMADAAVCLIWSAVASRCLAKYGDRGIRYLLLDAGHICQNTLLAAEALGCCGCPVAAFYDAELNELLGIDGSKERALYGAAIGRKE